MLGIKYVIENKLQNNSDYNSNTRFTLQNPVGKNRPSIIDLLLVDLGCQDCLSCSLWHITMEYYNHMYNVILMQIQLVRNHRQLKP